MPEKFKRLNKIALGIFAGISAVLLVVYFLALLLGAYSIAAQLLDNLITTVILSTFLLVTNKIWSPEKADPKMFHCLNCGEERPLARIPKNFNQLITGGWNCKKCGSEVVPPGGKRQMKIALGLLVLFLMVGLIGLFLIFLS